MKDYKSGKGLSKKEELANLAMCAAADPILFNEAVRDEK